MKFDMTKTVTDLSGAVIPWGETKVPLTVGVAIVGALTASPSQSIPVEKSFKRYELAKRCFPGGDVDLIAEDIIVIKECLGQVYAPLILGFVVEVLNGAA